MKKILFVILFVGKLFSQNLSPLSIQKLEKFILHELEDKKIPSISISVVSDKKIIYENGFGFSDKNKNIPATENTIYRVGSISKIFTAIAVMQLHEKKILSIDAPIENILPNFKIKNPSLTKITLRQIMSHRSGLLREPPIGNYFDPTEASLEKTALSVVNTSLIYAPETETKYSNAAIGVAGYAVEIKSKMPFEKFVKDSILKILGMENSTFMKSDSIAKNVSHSLMWSFDNREYPAPVFDFGFISAANLFSSTQDLAKFLMVCFNDGVAENGVILKKETFDEMKKVQFQNNKTGFGIGFYIGDFFGHKTIQHGGAVYGFATQLIGLTDEKVGVAVVSSVDVTNIVSSRIAEYALKLFLAEKNNLPLPEMLITSEIPKQVSKKLQGQYKNRNGEVIELFSREKGIYFVSSNMRGYLKLNGDTLIFDDRQFFGNKIYQFKKGIIAFKDTFQFIGNPKPKEMPKHFKGLIGEYGFENLPLFIFERFGKLNALIELTEQNPLEEINQNEFGFPKNYNMYESEKIIFDRDKSGKAKFATTAGIKFNRRKIIGESEETFSITPLKPLNELEITAEKSVPPLEENKLAEELVEIKNEENKIIYDIRYASTNNFMKYKFYKIDKAFLIKPAALALEKANQKLKKFGFGIVVFDAYRPWYVTKMFWDATPSHQKIFVANPEKGSRHNRGCAVDLSLYDLKTGKLIEMVGQYDEMSERSFPDYVGGTSLQRWHREILRTAMEESGFDVYEYEWWHFDFIGWEKYQILNKKFEEIIK